MTAIITRRATLDDLDAIAPLFDAYRQFYQQPADLALARRYVQERMQRGESVIFVAEGADRRPVGFTQLYPTFCSVRAAPTFVLYDLFVAPGARGTGAGRALMQAAEAYAASTGAARLELSTARTNTIAQSLYESQGWNRDEAFYVYHKLLRKS
ncbi:MAG TPA: GNAT family N-acetyltransferase [Steroidobacteraceae bacterium]|nr:GNAT family N-acetyltransferase [Steroidobacteraceae bacterium]